MIPCMLFIKIIMLCLLNVAMSDIATAFKKKKIYFLCIIWSRHLVFGPSLHMGLLPPGHE